MSTKKPAVTRLLRTESTRPTTEITAVGRRHAHDGVDHRQGQREEEGQGYLGEYRAVPHPLRDAQAGEDLIARHVVRRLAELLEGQHRRGGEEKDHAQIESHEQHQDLAAHILRVDSDAGVQRQREPVGKGGGAVGGGKGVLGGLLVAPVVGAEDLPPGPGAPPPNCRGPQDSGSYRCSRSRWPDRSQGADRPRPGPARLEGHQRVVVGEQHHGIGVVRGDAGDGGVVVVEEKVVLLPQQSGVKAGLCQPAGRSATVVSPL